MMIGTHAATRWMGIATVLAMLSACASSPKTPVAESSVKRPAAATSPRPLTPSERATVIAVNQIGVPYRYGGSSPSGFDCSGLVFYAYGQVGRSVPRTTKRLWSAARPVPTDDLRKGDLLFFRFDGKMSHVGLYVGHGRFVHAPRSGKRVRVQSLYDGVYREAFIRAGRL